MSDFETLLESSGMTKKELAARLHLDPTTPSKWPRGREPVYAIEYLKIYNAVRTLADSVL